MEIRQLQYFAACVETGSMSSAAALLYTSQPSVSHVIGALERELGTRLFFRGGRGLRLTEAGHQFYEQTLNVLKAVGVMSSLAGTGEKAALRLVTTPSGKMAELFADFCRETPSEQSCYYYEADGEDVLRRVAASEAEIGFLFVADSKRAAFSYALNRQRLAFTRLLTTDMVICAGPGNPYYNAPSVTAEDLTRLRFVQPVDDFFSLGDVIVLPAGTGKSAPLRCAVRTNSDRAMLRLLETTDLCNLSSYWLRTGAGQGKLRLIPVAGYEGTIQFGYVSARQEPLSGQARAFVDHVAGAVETARGGRIREL